MRRVIKAFSYLLTPAAKRFTAALWHPQQAQQCVQQRLINQLKHCEYGHHYNIRSREDWHKLPIVSYEDLQPWLNQSLTPPNTNSPLTPEPILFYEPTSGSRGPIKQIPYTRSLRKSFNHLFCVWAHDLITQGPHFSKGKLYFSISPSFSDMDGFRYTDTSGGTADDADYLDPWLRWLLKPFFVMSPAAKSPEDFKEKLAKTLLLAKDLEIISVWSPSFLTVQLDYIQKYQAQLAETLRASMSVSRRTLLLQNKIDWSALWPELKLISCWDSVMAAEGASGLRLSFPNTLIQGKGLLATEAPMTVPLIAANGHVPLLDEIYFEFEDSQGQCHELHQLDVGTTYEVIVSQMGGLYRYRMFDRVQVTHTYLNTPCLDFQGRGQDMSDLVGEKLSAQFVTTVLNQLSLSDSRYQSLVALSQPSPHYTLLLDAATQPIEVVAQQLESKLCESFHYYLARQLGQLMSARVIIAADIAEQMAAFKARSGQRWGDIKHTKFGGNYTDLTFLGDFSVSQKE